MTQGPDRFAQIAFGGRQARAGGLWAPVLGLMGLVATAVAVLVGAALALFTAIAVAVFAVIAGLLMFLTGLASRARRGMGRDRAAPADGVIEARKVDGAWVAYGWERSGR